MHHPRHHLDQRCLTGPRLTIAHEGENEPAQFGKGVQLAIKIISHQHLGQLHRLILGDVIADHLVGLFERHGEGGGFGLGGGGEPSDRKIIRLNAPFGIGEGL